MEFNILRTNIVNECEDAIVLPANTHLREGSGVSKAIFEAAGRKELKEECAKIGHCDLGMAVPTPACNLNAKYIIHAVVPRWVDGKHGEYALLTSAYLAALNVADVMQCESIAFPLLASGNNGFDKKLAFQIAKESFESFSGKYLKKITLVVYGMDVEFIAKSLGYNVTFIEDALLRKRKAEQKERKERIEAEGQKLIEMGKTWLKDEENQEKLKDWGVRIATTVIETKIG